MTAKIRKVIAANVLLYGNKVGAVAWNEERQFAQFEFEPAFIRDGYDISPIVLPRRSGIVSFPNLNRVTYHGLPGLLADSLPDKFGNALIDAWLALQGRSADDFSPVERLCYIGTRGMGALEFKPAIGEMEGKRAVPVEIGKMVELAQIVLDGRTKLWVNLKDEDRAISTIIHIGTSAGGARAKALINWNPKTNEVRSGQVPPPSGFEPWIIKFDGVKDKALGQTQSFGRIEYSYSQMATRAGIVMNECRLFEENDRAHFMTMRFDRTRSGEKIHMQSLCALEHFDFNMPGAYSYEQALTTIQKLNLGYDTLEQLYRRMVFNIIARNQDDHTKNIAFLMDKEGKWSLSPAFDVMWAYNSEGMWTNQHQMSVNGKRDGFSLEDLLAPARAFKIKKAKSVVAEVAEAVTGWPRIARENGVPPRVIKQVGDTHRIAL